MQNDLKEAASDSREAIKETVSKAGEAAEGVKAKIASGLDDTKEKFRDLGNNLSDKAASSAEETDRVIRENPYRSLWIAFGLGFIAALILKRR